MEHLTPRLAVAGTGMVGGALVRYLRSKGLDPGVFDPPKGFADPQVLAAADIVFLAVPTPYYLDGRGFDDSFLREAIAAIPASDDGRGKTIVIKSTVIPGTTERFQREYPQHGFLFNPEFLTEANADRDMAFPTRQIMGYTAQSQAMAQTVMDLLPPAPYNAAIPAVEAELVKYFGNAFLAMRVAFANQMYDICQAMQVDYATVRDAAAADPRIGPSHLDVAHGGYRGYGGKCLPKDMRSLIQLARACGIEPGVLAAAEDYNNALIRSQGLDVAWKEGVARPPMIDAVCKACGMDRGSLKRECLQLVRYAVVGLSSFAMYATVYGVLTRLLFPEANRSVMNLFSVCSVATFNFLAHQRFTYKADRSHAGQAMRYLMVIASGTALNASGFWVGHERLGIDDRLMVVIMSASVPIYTYIMHRQFTFKKRSTAETAPSA